MTVFMKSASLAPPRQDNRRSSTITISASPAVSEGFLDLLKSERLRQGKIGNARITQANLLTPVAVIVYCLKQIRLKFSQRFRRSCFVHGRFQHLGLDLGQSLFNLLLAIQKFPVQTLFQVRGGFAE